MEIKQKDFKLWDIFENSNGHASLIYDEDRTHFKVMNHNNSIYRILKTSDTALKLLSRDKPGKVRQFLFRENFSAEFLLNYNEMLESLRRVFDKHLIDQYNKDREMFLESHLRNLDNLQGQDRKDYKALIFSQMYNGNTLRPPNFAYGEEPPKKRNLLLLLIK